MSLDVVVSGYPSIDHILPVNRAPQPGQTGVILQPPELERPTLGGCPCNIAVACARLGLQAAPVILIGDDADGKRMVTALQAEGVDTEFGVHVVPEGHTSHAFLFFDPHNQHQTFYYPGVSDREDVALRLSGSARWGAVTVGNAKHNITFLEWLVEQKIPVLWSHKNDALAFPRALVERLAVVSRIIVLNEAEAEAIQQTLGLSSLDDLFGEGVHAIILTKSAEGSVIIERDRSQDIPAVQPRELVDTTGAGDAFTAGVLFGLRHQLPLEVCGRIGSVVASFAVEVSGCQANLPHRSDMLARYAEVYGESLHVGEAE